MFVGENMMTHISSQPEMPRRRWKSGSGDILGGGARERARARAAPSSPARTGAVVTVGEHLSTCSVTPVEREGGRAESWELAALGRLFARSSKGKLARCSTSPTLSPSLGDGADQEEGREGWRESSQETCL